MNDQEKLKWITEYIFKDLNLSDIDILNKYPRRNLKENAKVTRFAPSPTGFIHIGGIYAAMLSEKIAHQSNGVFYLRIEDTDKKREIEGTIEIITKSLNRFNINIDEGFISEDEQIGDYGPYIQSQRKEIYQAFVKKLLLEGKAYVCFATAEELENISNMQSQRKELIGYRKEWAIWRNKSLDEVIENLKINKPFVVRFKSNGDFNNKIKFIDQIKGEVELPENELDVVIMKGDGLPTYHFAHVIDDYLMGTTDVIRGDEWLSSVPIHLELFDALNFDKPRFLHLAPIEKLDGNSRRKLSKRKDPEASVEFYYEEGYPVKAIMEYLLNLVNSNYEDWKVSNPDTNIDDFKIDISKLKVSGALFDFDKLNYFSREFISKLSADGVYNYVLGWAKNYNEKLFNLLFKNKDYAISIFNIEREGEGKKRKDLYKWSIAYDEICYFFDEEFDSNIIDSNLISPVNFEDAKLIINEFINSFNINDSLDVWFGKIKDIARKFNYADSLKEYKLNPDNFKGNVADVAKIFRVALTGRTQSPDLYQIMQVMGQERLVNRLNNFVKLLN
jgi:glutamyl-tRNA synthetase